MDKNEAIRIAVVPSGQKINSVPASSICCSSLVDARNAIRSIKQQNAGKLPAPIDVVLSGGTHFLDQTLVFSPEDSGAESHPITYRSCPNERAIVSGGQKLTGWEVGTHEGKPCWRLKLPEAADGRWFFAQLFVNGERRPRPRLPKHEYYRFEAAPEDGQYPSWHRVSTGKYYPGHLQYWRNLRDVEIIALQLFFENHLRISKLDEESRIVTFKTPGWHTLMDETGNPARYFVENVVEALSEPGEWYLDRASGEMTYLTRPGETPADVNVIAPKLDRLIFFEGSQTANGPKVEHIRFEHISFQHAEWRLPIGNPGAIQGSFTTPGAIQLRGAAHCAFYACEVCRVGQSGIEIQMGSHHNRVVACSIHDLGAGGIKINHESGLLPWDSEVNDVAFDGMDPVAMGWGALGCDCQGHPRAGIDESAGGYNTITDCEIFDGGKIFISAVGIWIGDSGYNTITHNDVHDFNNSGISVGWRWDFSSCFARANRIEFNHVRNIGRGVLSDMGGIYLLGVQPGTVVRGNIIHDVHGQKFSSNGIYPDQGSSFILVEGNLVYDCDAYAFGGNSAEFVLVRENIFGYSWHNRDELYCAKGVVGENGCVNRLAYVLERNVIICSSPHMLGANGSLPNKRYRANLFWRDEGRSLNFYGMSLEQFEHCHWGNSNRIVDPLFRNPRDGDFSVRKGSPVPGNIPKWDLWRKAGQRIFSVLPERLENWPQKTEPLPVLLVPQLNIGEEFPKYGEETESGSSEKCRPPRVLRIPPDTMRKFIYRIVNVGKVSARGQVTFRLQPADVGRITPTDAVLAYELQPGEIKSFSFALEIRDIPDLIWLESVPDNPYLPAIARLIGTPEHQAKATA